jgi:hypothetical protein
VVGGLVEQQQVGAAHQRLGQVEAHPPAAGEVGHRALQVGGGEAQPVEQGRGAGAGGIAADLLQAAVEVADLLAVVGRFGAFQGGFDAAQFGIAVEHIVDGRAGQGRRLLGHMGDGP